jgi:hypothetical protein
MARARPAAVASNAQPPDSEDLIYYCANPKCREEFRRAAGPGRRREYCNELCRRTAQKELRQLHTKLARFEDLADQARADIAAHGRDDDNAPIDPLRTAEVALARAEGALPFAKQSPDPFAEELRLLFEAVAPVIRRSS